MILVGLIIEQYVWLSVLKINTKYLYIFINIQCDN